MKTEVRLVTENDFEQIAGFLPDMWLSHALNSKLVNKEGLLKLDVLEYLKQVYRDQKQRGFIAMCENKIIGFIRCEIRDCPDYYNFKDEIYIDDLIVLKAFRKQGVATELISECISFANDKDIKLMTCKIWDFNNESRALFEKLGFKRGFSFYSSVIGK